MLFNGQSCNFWVSKTLFRQFRPFIGVRNYPKKGQIWAKFRLFLFSDLRELDIYWRSILCFLLNKFVLQYFPFLEHVKYYCRRVVLWSGGCGYWSSTNAHQYSRVTIPHTSQKPHKNLTKTSQRPHKDLTKTPQRAHKDLTKTSQRPHKDLTKISQRSHKDPTKTSQRPHMTPHKQFGNTSYTTHKHF